MLHPTVQRWCREEGTCPQEDIPRGIERRDQGQSAMCSHRHHGRRSPVPTQGNVPETLPRVRTLHVDAAQRQVGDTAGGGQGGDTAGGGRVGEAVRTPLPGRQTTLPPL
eukprot:scaffold30627_cov84-Isochrysis_galbana.AAC.1